MNLKKRNPVRIVILLLVIIAGIVGMAYFLNHSQNDKAETWQYTEFLKNVRDGKVSCVYAVDTRMVGLKTESKISKSSFPGK